MFEPKVKIPRRLFQALEKSAKLQGYATVEELILHALEKAATPAESSAAEDKVRERLKGLGYIE